MVDATANSLMLIVTRSVSANADANDITNTDVNESPKPFLKITLTLMLNAITEERTNASTCFSANANNVDFRDRL